MKQKVIMAAIAVVLILIIAAIGIGKPVMERYGYGTDYRDLTEYYEVTGDEFAIILQDHMIKDKALFRDNRLYFARSTVESYLTDGFYYEEEAPALLYTTATYTAAVPVSADGRGYDEDGRQIELGYAGAFEENGTIYLAADYVKKFAQFDYAVYDRHIQLTTEWGTYQAMTVKKDTQIRVLGGNKSEILRDVKAGETVELLEAMDTWSKVKTSDAFLGYIENKFLVEAGEVTETEAIRPDLPEYTSVRPDGKVNLGFHAIYGTAGNATISEVMAEGKGINVLAPTWLRLGGSGENASMTSFAGADYVNTAHAAGIQVWGVVDNFNMDLENGTALDLGAYLSKRGNRTGFIQYLMDEAARVGLDGINVDFESVPAEAGPHYVQFLKELSVACRAAGLVLSVDNYVPFHFNNHYRLDVQGQICDYVIIMGYDEHWHGSGDPGSVASLSYVSNGLDKTMESVPAEKIVNALPFYMILWKTNGQTVTDEYITLNNLADFLSRVGTKPSWDEATGQNYAEWTSGTTTYQIWCEDADSISAKLNVMNAREIGGVAVWRLGYGTSEVWNLVSAYANN